MEPAAKKKKKLWREEDMLQALEKVRSGMKVREASRVFNVPRNTLRDRVCGRVVHGTRTGPKPLLSEKDETELVQYCLYCTQQGFPLTKDQLIAFASSLRQKRNSEPIKSFGTKWWNLFKKRHPDIKLSKTKNMRSLLTSEEVQINSAHMPVEQGTSEMDESVSTERVSALKKRKVTARNSKSIKTKTQQKDKSHQVSRTSHNPSVNKKKLWHEEDMLQALEEVRSGMKVREASRVFNVPRNTLRDRVFGRVVHGTRTGPKPSLSEKDESDLVQYCIYCAEHGFPLTKERLIAFASSLRQKRSPENSKVLSGKWWSLFKKRHSNILSMRTPSKISRYRSICTTKATLQKYFELLKNTLEEHGLKDKPRQIYNCDESGFDLSKNYKKVLAAKGSACVNQQARGSDDYISVLVCFNAVGEDVPPFFIYPKTFPRNLHAVESFQNALSGTSPSGYIDGNLFHKWFGHFVKYAVQERPLLLIFDSHKSHLNPEMIAEAKKEGVILLCLPPNTSHILQPLDVSFFMPLKSRFAKLCGDACHVNNAFWVDKNNFATFLHPPYEEVKGRKIIVQGFRKCGIYPLNPDAVDYSNIPQSHSEETANEERESLLSSEEMPCTSSLVSSSPSPLDSTPTSSPLKPLDHPLVKNGLIPKDIVDILTPKKRDRDAPRSCQRLKVSERVLTSDELGKMIHKMGEPSCRKQRKSTRKQSLEYQSELRELRENSEASLSEEIMDQNQCDVEFISTTGDVSVLDEQRDEPMRSDNEETPLIPTRQTILSIKFANLVTTENAGLQEGQKGDDMLDQTKQFSTPRNQGAETTSEIILDFGLYTSVDIQLSIEDKQPIPSEANSTLLTDYPTNPHTEETLQKPLAPPPPQEEPHQLNGNALISSQMKKMYSKLSKTSQNRAGEQFQLLSKTMDQLGLQDKPGQIYSCNMLPVICNGGESKKRDPNSRSVVSVLMCFSARGDHIPPLKIYTWGFPGGPYKFGGVKKSIYEKTPNGRMDKKVFNSWFKHFVKHAVPQRPLVLLFEGHRLLPPTQVVAEAEKEQVTFLCLSERFLQPLTTSFLDPLLSGFARAAQDASNLKNNYSVERTMFAMVFRKPYDELKERKVVLEGFKTTGIYPLIPDALSLCDIAPSHSTNPCASTADDPCSVEENSNSVEEGTAGVQSSDQLACPLDLGDIAPSHSKNPSVSAADNPCSSAGAQNSEQLACPSALSTKNYPPVSTQLKYHPHPLVARGIIQPELADILTPIKFAKRTKGKVVSTAKVLTSDDYEEQLRKETMRKTKQATKHKVTPDGGQSRVKQSLSARKRSSPWIRKLVDLEDMTDSTSSSQNLWSESGTSSSDLRSEPEWCDRSRKDSTYSKYSAQSLQSESHKKRDTIQIEQGSNEGRRKAKRSLVFESETPITAAESKRGQADDFVTLAKPPTTLEKPALKTTTFEASTPPKRKRMCPGNTNKKEESKSTSSIHQWTVSEDGEVLAIIPGKEESLTVSVIDEEGGKQAQSVLSDGNTGCITHQVWIKNVFGDHIAMGHYLD